MGIRSLRAVYYANIFCFSLTVLTLAPGVSADDSSAGLKTENAGGKTLDQLPNHAAGVPDLSQLQLSALGGPAGAAPGLPSITPQQAAEMKAKIEEARKVLDAQVKARNDLMENIE